MIKYIIVVLILIINSYIYSAFEESGCTARSKALSESIFAEFDGVNSMNYNPATIGMAKSIQAYISWDTPYLGLNDGTFINNINLMGVFPFFNKFTIPAENPIASFISRRGAIGISIKRLSLTGNNLDGSLSEIYHEGIYSLIYAKDLNDVIFRGARISAGVRFSLYDIGVGNYYDVIANNKVYSDGAILLGLGFGLDVGLTYDFSEEIKIGIIFKNLIQPKISIIPDGQDYLPGEMRLGLNWNFGDLYFLYKFKLGLGMITYGRDATDPRQPDAAYVAGIEFKELPASLLVKGKSYKDELFAIRMGVKYQDNKINEDIVMISSGLGFTYIFEKLHQINIDYSLEYIINMGSFKHAIGFTYQYLIPKSMFLYKKQLEEEEEVENLLQVVEWKTNVILTNINNINLYLTNIYSNNILINVESNISNIIKLTNEIKQEEIKQEVKTNISSKTKQQIKKR